MSATLPSSEAHSTPAPGVESVAKSVALAGGMAGGAPEGSGGIEQERVRWGIVVWHIIASACVQATWFASQFLLPVLARKRFEAGEWETLLITATPTIFFALSIFWNDLFSRRSFARYLMVFWLWGCLPYAFVAFAQNYWMLLVPHLLACIGGAGLHPASGELLRALYPDKVRGRIYSWVWGSSMVFGAGVGFGLGKWLTHDGESFRIYMPLLAGLQGVGVGVFVWLAHKSGHLSRRKHSTAADVRSTWKRVVEPLGHMRETLKADPVFTRYEAAYMTYGVGWMIGTALLPILVTEKLKLNYDQISASTYTTYQLAMFLMIIPAGFVMDRLGAVKTAAISFAMLTLYPIGLVLSGNQQHLTIASMWFGIAHVGGSMAWMLGPVSLAPTPEKVPQYVAIHATLVGVRGKVFQFLGVGLYLLTHSFAVPLILAAVAYLWAGYQMWTLDAQVRARKAERDLNR